MSQKNQRVGLFRANHLCYLILEKFSRELVVDPGQICSLRKHADDIVVEEDHDSWHDKAFEFSKLDSPDVQIAHSEWILSRL